MEICAFAGKLQTAVAVNLGVVSQVFSNNDSNSLNHLVCSGALLSEAPRSCYGCRRGGFRRHARAAQGNHGVDVLHAGLG